MTFPAQQNWLIIGDFAAIMVNIGLQVLKVVAVITAKIQAMVKNHILVCAERQV
jgi:hypothetical protein